MRHRLSLSILTKLIDNLTTGIGIPPDQSERIFERFYQVDGGIRRRYGGIGLGLALVKEVVEAHGGMTVQSTLGEGSTFRVALRRAEYDHSCPDSSQSSNRRWYSGSSYRSRTNQGA